MLIAWLNNSELPCQMQCVLHSLDVFPRTQTNKWFIVPFTLIFSRFVCHQSTFFCLLFIHVSLFLWPKRVFANVWQAVSIASHFATYGALPSIIPLLSIYSIFSSSRFALNQIIINFYWFSWSRLSMIFNVYISFILANLTTPLNCYSIRVYVFPLAFETIWSGMDWWKCGREQVSDGSIAW